MPRMRTSPYTISRKFAPHRALDFQRYAIGVIRGAAAWGEATAVALGDSPRGGADVPPGNGEADPYAGAGGDTRRSGAERLRRGRQRWRAGRAEEGAGGHL